MPALCFVTSSLAPLVVDEWRCFEEKFGVRVAAGRTGSSEVGWEIAAQLGGSSAVSARSAGWTVNHGPCPLLAPKGQMLKRGEMGVVELGGLRGNV